VIARTLYTRTLYTVRSLLEHSSRLICLVFKRESVVGIAARYGSNGTGFKSWWGKKISSSA